MGQLAARMAGAELPAYALTWEDEDGNARAILGTVTANITNLLSKATIAQGSGQMSITNSTNGTFTWTPDSTAVAAAGEYSIYFIDTTAGQTYKSIPMGWAVIDAPTP